MKASEWAWSEPTSSYLTSINSTGTDAALAAYGETEEGIAAVPRGLMVLSKRVSRWSLEDVLEWVQEQHPSHTSTLQKAFIKHAISGRALLRLRDHHLERLGLDADEQLQEILQDLLLLRVQEEISELEDLCSDGFSP